MLANRQKTGKSLKQTWDMIVLGSGLVAHELCQILSRQRQSLKVLVIDISQAILISQIESNSSLFTTAINRTAAPGGGAGFWGSKVTIPTEHNWFSSSRDNKDWRKFGEWVISESETFTRTDFLTSVMGGLSQTSKRSNLSFESSRNRDQHVFLADREGLNSQILKFGNFATQLSHLTEMFYANGRYHVTGLLKGNSELVSVDSPILVLASGPVGNAILSSYLTNIRQFSLGNHGGIRVGKLRFDRIRNLKSDGYLRDRKNFYSFGVFDGVENLNHSFRFTVDEDRPNSLDSVMSTRSDFSKLTSLIDLAYLSLGATRSCEVSAFLDSGPIATMILEEGAGGYELGMNRFKTIRISAESERLRAITTRLLAEIQAQLNGAGLNFEPYQSHFLEDQIHYFGTTPMGTRGDRGLGIDSYGQSSVFPGLFALGAGSFAAGSHGHPTYLSVLTAHRAVLAML